MTRTQRCWKLALVLLAVVPFGCAVPYGGSGARRTPEYKPPSDAEMQQMANRMMGKAPAKQLPVSTDGVQVVFQTGHAGGIRAVALSPNDRYIASSGAQDGTVKVWDVAGGQEVRTLTGFDMLGTDLLTFSPDSTRVITKDMTGGVKVFEVASGREVRSVGSLALSPGGATVSADGRITVSRESRGKTSLAVIDLTTGASLWTLPDSEAQHPVALSPDGKILLTTKTDTSMSRSIGSLFGFGRPSLPTIKQELLIWDLPAKKLRRTWPINMAEGTGGYSLGAKRNPPSNGIRPRPD